MQRFGSRVPSSLNHLTFLELTMYATVKPNEAVKCPKCKGTGLFFFSRKSAGKCFTCLGSGVQNYSDYKRCQSYWRNYARA